MKIANIIDCARCGQNHDPIDASELARPFAPSAAGGLTWTHWAPCPTNGEPILFIILPDPDEPKPAIAN